MSKAKNKINLGCGPLPFHAQHLDIMGGLEGWTLVDKYVKDPKIENWDAEVLLQVPDNSVDIFYASHLLEHLPHKNIEKDLALWFKKMKSGGRLIINVPDMAWLASEIFKYESGQKLESDYFTTFAGDHGLLSVIYGSQSHEGEFHKAGFTEKYISELLFTVGFKNIKTKTGIDAHQMGVIVVIAEKP